MNINRDNYEIYFIDYIDGVMNAKDTAELMIFLTENPDLEVLLKNFEIIPVDVDDSIYKEKGSLKEIALKPIIINSENFENTCICQIEGLLTPAETGELERYLKKHPDKRYDYELFQKTIFTDHHIIYEDKLSLKRTYKFRQNREAYYTIISAAASIIIILTILFILRNNPSLHNSNILANKGQTKTDPGPGKKPVITVNTETQAERGSISMINNQSKPEGKAGQKKELSYRRKTKENQPDTTITGNIAYPVDEQIKLIQPRKIMTIETNITGSSKESKDLEIPGGLLKLSDTINQIHSRTIASIFFRKPVFRFRDKILNMVLDHSDRDIEIDKIYNREGEIQMLMCYTESINFKINISKR